MSFVTTHPEALAYAAGKLQTLGSALAAKSAAAAPQTTGVIPAAADEISALQAAIFRAYGSLYQSVNAQATTIHDLFVQTLGASAGSYAATESANSGCNCFAVVGGDVESIQSCRERRPAGRQCRQPDQHRRWKLVRGCVGPAQYGSGRSSSWRQ